MICATPSGSTAYNLSNGGPVLVCGLDAMAVTFIAPHSLHARPLVVPRGLERDAREPHAGRRGRRARRRPPAWPTRRPARDVASASAPQRSLLATLPETTFFGRYREIFTASLTRTANGRRRTRRDYHRRDAATAAHREPRADPGGGAGARARAQRDHRRDRRGQDDPRAGGRAPARREGRRLVRRPGRGGGVRRGGARPARGRRGGAGGARRAPARGRGRAARLPPRLRATGARARTRGAARPRARTSAPRSSA